MNFNWIAILLAALSALVIGFIWYNPRVFGAVWMKEIGITEEQLKGSNMFKMLAGTFVYAFLISFILQFLVIHQMGAYGMIGGDPTLAKPSFNAFMADYGTAFRTFKQGALHGFMSGLFLALPLIGTGALYEKRSFKYVLIAGGFWVVCFTVMGGIICMMQ
ncbi:MAG: hypothetical protein RL427_1867 [Bacteroidota bacterium]|jgi:hypothetical protein